MLPVPLFSLFEAAVPKIPPLPFRSVGGDRDMHGAKSSEARAADQPSRSPSLPLGPKGPSLVSLRPLKELVRKLSPSHPLRILLLGEPDAMPAAEFSSKISGWLRLLTFEHPGGQS